jgi:hypothetical protein
MSLQTDLEAQLTAINALITAKLAGGPVANWSVGDVSFREADTLEMLYKQRDSIVEMLRSTPSESWATVQNNVSPLGQDYTEYVGDDL